MSPKTKIIQQLVDYARSNQAARVLSRQEGPDHEEIYLELEPLAGRKVTIFLLLGRPAGPGPFPTILHVHGGGQTADLEHVRHWVKEGFAACSYDWTGPKEGRAKTSDLGQLATEYLAHALDPLQSALLLRLLLAIAVLGWLARQTWLDPQKIGVYGISWGGTISWLLGHYEPRLKAVAPIYGCGGHLDPARKYWTSAFSPFTAADSQAWQAALDGVFLADRQYSPLLLLNATNDFWGWLDAADQALARLGPAQGSRFLVANLNHQLDRYAATTLTAWMKTHLLGEGCWPQPAQLSFAPDQQGHLAVKVLADPAKPVQELRLNWSFADFSLVAAPARYWHSQSLAASCGQILVPLPDLALAVLLYADVIYKDQTKVSSPLSRVSPLALGVKEATPELGFYASTANFGWQCSDTRTEPFDSEYNFFILESPQGQKVLTVPDLAKFSLTSNKFTDPAWHRPGCQDRLQIPIFASVPGSWQLEVIFRPDQAGERIWSHSIAASGWQTLDLTITDFRSSQGQPLPAWSFLERLTVSFCPDDSTQPDYQAGLGDASWL